MFSPQKTETVGGVSMSPHRVTVSLISTGIVNTSEVIPTVSSVVIGPSSVASVVPYDSSFRMTPLYNSSAMYEDQTLPMYVDYIGNIMPVLDRQSIASNWLPTPHPFTGQIRYVPFNRGNLPMVPYLMSVGSPLLPQPISGQPALSEITSETQHESFVDSVSQIGVITVQSPVTGTIASLPTSEKKQTVSIEIPRKPLGSKILVKEGNDQEVEEKSVSNGENLSPVDMELTVPYIEHAQEDVPFLIS